MYLVSEMNTFNFFDQCTYFHLQLRNFRKTGRYHFRNPVDEYYVGDGIDSDSISLTPEDNENESHTVTHDEKSNSSDTQTHDDFSL